MAKQNAYIQLLYINMKSCNDSNTVYTNSSTAMSTTEYTQQWRVQFTHFCYATMRSSWCETFVVNLHFKIIYLIIYTLIIHILKNFMRVFITRTDKEDKYNTLETSTNWSPHSQKHSLNYLDRIWSYEVVAASSIQMLKCFPSNESLKEI